MDFLWKFPKDGIENGTKTLRTQLTRGLRCLVASCTQEGESASKELIERSFAHCYQTGGMRRTHLRGRENILKRQLVHVCAFNLSLIFRLTLGAGTPRELRNRRKALFSAFMWLQMALMALESPAGSPRRVPQTSDGCNDVVRRRRSRSCRPRNFGGSATGC